MLSDIYTLWLREMLRFVRARSRIISSIAMPFFWLVFIGVGIGSSFKLPDVNYISFLAPGIVGMTVLFTSIFTGVSVIWERQFGFLKEMLVAPVSRTSIVLGKTFGGATIALINAFLMILIAAAFGIIALGPGILLSIIFIVLTSMCFVLIGLIIASRMRSMEGFQMIMSFLIMPTFFLSGAIFPLANTPGWMQIISFLDPLTYGVDGIRASLIGMTVMPLWISAVVLLAIDMALVFVCAYFFRKSM
ncbi:MAG: ABC transporter permease [Candidatus Aenigmatarchaeota archaeon]